MQLGRTLTWDPEKGEVVDDEEANKLLAGRTASPGSTRPPSRTT